jgi:hypothetical protein
MMKKVSIVTILALLVAFAVIPEAALANPLKGKGLGGTLSDLTGKSKSSRKAELIGTAVLGVMNFIIEQSQKELATKEEMEEEYKQEHGKEPDKTTVFWKGFNVTPDRVKTEETITLKGEYILIGPEASKAPKGKVCFISDDGEELASKEFDLKVGKQELTHSMVIPESQEAGVYKLVGVITYEDTEAKKMQPFEIVE